MRQMIHHRDTEDTENPDRETRRQGDKESKAESRISFPPPLRVSLSHITLCLCGSFLFFPSLDTTASSVVVPVEGMPFSGELVAVGDDGELSFRVDDPAAAAGKPEQAEIRSLKADE